MQHPVDLLSVSYGDVLVVPTHFRISTSAAMAMSPRIMADVDRRCSDGTAMTTSDSRGMGPQLFSIATMDFTWAMVPVDIYVRIMFGDFRCFAW